MRITAFAISTGLPRGGIMHNRSRRNPWRLALVLSLPIGACTPETTPRSSRPPPPRAAASLAVEPVVRMGQGTRWAQEARGRSLTAEEQETISWDNVAESELLITVIRRLEAGDSVTWFSLPASSHPDLTTGFCGALRAWYLASVSQQPPDPVALFSQHGVAALFADVAIHNGAGHPTLRALAGVAGELQSFEATVAAELARVAATIPGGGGISARVTWILSSTMPTDMKALQLFDLGDAAVVELASLYGNDTGGGAGGVSHEELAYLFARSALGRKHASSALLSETDLARPQIAAYVTELQEVVFGAWDFRASRAGIFSRDEFRQRAGQTQLDVVTPSPEGRF